MPNETLKNRCRYYCQKTEWQCPRETLPDSEDGFCICHEKRDDKDEDSFLEEVEKVLANESTDALHFEGFYFPFEMAFFEWDDDKPEFRQFKKDTYFTDAVFKGTVSFWGAEFLGGMTDFFRVRFMGDQTEFDGTRFLGEQTDFSGARFLGKRTSFYKAQFCGDLTEFSATHFEGEWTSFSEAEFRGPAACFVWAEFLADETDFSSIAINSLLDFSEANFRSEQTRLHSLRIRKRGKVIFRDTTFEQTNRNDLGKMELSKCFFRGTNLQHCDLSLAVLDWKTKVLNESLSEQEYGQVVRLEDGFNIDEADRFSEAAECYRMLKVNFNNKQDYGKAAICHFREWDCRRKALNLKTPVGLITSFFYWLLRCSCGYGEKLQNVLGFTVFLFLLFSVILSFTPLIPVSDGVSTALHADGWQQLHYWDKFRGALKYAFFHLLPLWRFSDLRAVTDLGNITSGVMTVAGAFMIGLFIYVFRRRLMR